MIVGLAAATVLATAGFAGGPAAAVPGGLRPFADCAEFTTHMRGLAAAEAERMVHRLHVDAYAPYGYIDGLAGPLGLHTEPMPDYLYPPGPAEASDPGAQPPEPGAHRPDEVAVAGIHVLTLTLSNRGPALRVVDVAGGEPRLAARMRLPYAGRELLLLDDRRVLVVASFDAAWPGLPAPWRTPQTALMRVDLADPARPVLTRTQKITGQYVSARLRGGVLQLVVDSPIRPPGLPRYERGPRELAMAQARDAAARASTRTLLPMRQILDGRGRLVGAEPLLRCVDVLTPARPGDGGIVSVLTFATRAGLGGFDHAHAVGVLGDGDLVHAAGDRVYLAAPDEREGATATRVHAFGVAAPDRSRYLATVRLDGRLLQGGGLSVRDGFLRAATHTPTGTAVHVLAERAGRFEVVGARDRLQAVPRGGLRTVRWFGRFAGLSGGQLLDLADPEDPVLVGTWDEGAYQPMPFLGRGRWLVLDHLHRERGLRAVLLDAAGPGLPRRLGELALGSGSAGASTGPGGLTYLPEGGLVVTPAVLMEPPVAGSQIRKKRVMHYVALAIAVGADGTLRPAGRVLRGSGIRRVVPAGPLPRRGRGLVADRRRPRRHAGARDAPDAGLTGRGVVRSAPVRPVLRPMRHRPGRSLRSAVCAVCAVCAVSPCPALTARCCRCCRCPAPPRRRTPPSEGLTGENPVARRDHVIDLRRRSGPTRPGRRPPRPAVGDHEAPRAAADRRERCALRRPSPSRWRTAGRAFGSTVSPYNACPDRREAVGIEAEAVSAGTRDLSRRT